MKKSKLVHKMSPFEFNSSMHQLELFKVAILSLNLELLNRLLCDKRKYLGGKSKAEVLELFQEWFTQELPEEYLTTEVGLMVSTRIFAGSVALMFHNGYWPKLNSNFEGGNAFVFKFSNGLLVGLELTNEFCTEDALEELCRHN